VVLTNNLPDSYQPLIVSLELVEESKLTVDYVIYQPPYQQRGPAGEGSEQGMYCTFCEKHQTQGPQVAESAIGVQMDESKIQVIRDWPTPRMT